MSASAKLSAPRIVLLSGALCDDAQALARGFARRGWDVALAVGPRDQAIAQALADEAETLGRRAAVIVADLAVEADASRLVPVCGELLGRPACIVHRTEPGHPDAPAGGYDVLADAFARDVAAPLALMRALHAATPKAADTDEALRAAMLVVFDAYELRAEPTSGRLPQALAAAALDRAAVFEARARAPRLRVTRLVRGTAARAEEMAEAACYLAEAPGVTGAMLTVGDGARSLRAIAEHS
jgi:hypothetical protein